MNGSELRRARLRAKQRPKIRTNASLLSFSAMIKQWCTAVDCLFWFWNCVADRAKFAGQVCGRRTDSRYQPGFTCIPDTDYVFGANRAITFLREMGKF
jgi:hypothetical protein